MFFLGTVKDDFGCSRWYLEVAGYVNKTNSQIYGQEIKWMNIGKNQTDPPILIYLRDFVR